MRVLVNAVHAKSGGGVTTLRHLLPALAAQPGLTLALAIQRDQRPLFADLPAAVTLHELPGRGKLGTVLWQEQVTIPALARRIGADVVFSPANYGPLFGPPAVILLRNAFEVTTLERRLDKRLYWAAVRGLTWACFRRCRRAIAVSAHAARAFLAHFGRDGDPRLSVIHHGVAPLYHPPAESEARIPGLLLAVSDLYVQKNFETLLRALARLAPTRPELRLEIAGRRLDPAYADRLAALVAELGLSDRVRFLGGQPPEAVAALYRRATLLAFPSLVETFGNPLVEAMASGLPVVCSDAAAMPEIVADAALLARPGDDGDFARQIARLLDEPGLAAELSRRGLARAAAFSWERTAAATADVLRAAAQR